ncbi:MAG: low molecular weight phosphotyrosine protein phosphatase [Thermoguttaceae bacterium]|nr:low molecular weight phosphotyrosine protein phosphatase [Thermoguttaceae bacterium]
MIKILFVCYGNICRSTMAEFVMKDKVAAAGLEREILVESAGTSDEEIGNPVYPGTRKVLAKRGIDCSGKYARQMTRADYANHDLLIGMERMNLAAMRRICGGDPEGKIRRLLDYTDSPGEIDDPWYHNDFERTYREVSAGCDALLDALKRELGAAPTD